MHIRDACGGTLRVHMSEAISIATGENDHVLVSPAGNVTSLPGELATFGESRGREKRRSLARSAPRLLPPGAMFNRQPGGVLVRVLEAFGASMRARVSWRRCRWWPSSILCLPTSCWMTGSSFTTCPMNA